jgi:hypothetical protein
LDTIVHISHYRLVLKKCQVIFWTKLDKRKVVQANGDIYDGFILHMGLVAAFAERVFVVPKIKFPKNVLYYYGSEGVSLQRGLPPVVWRRVSTAGGLPPVV